MALKKNKWGLSFIIPLIEPHIPNSAYGDLIKLELELFKERVNYEQLCIETNARLKTINAN